MSPLDDELRGALSSRTRAIDPPPDFFAGVERRATRMRRQKVGAAVAGSALAVTGLGLGGPLVASSLTGTAPSPVDRATSAPAPAVDRFALDPADPWAYRGVPLDELGDGLLEAVREQVAAVRGVGADVALTPLYGQLHEPSQQAELVFLAQVDGVSGWGVARASESGPQLLVDEPLSPGTTALSAALPGEAVSRLVVVAAEATDVQYCTDGPASCQSMGAGDGVGQTVLDGDTSGDAYRVLAPDGTVVAEGPAPDGEVLEGEPEGPGTGTPAEVDTAAYALDLEDPWAFRGPAELTQHPDLGSQDERLFVAGGTGRDDGSWSQRPLLALDDLPTGTSVLMVLHRSGGQAYVTTTWQTGDGEPRQSEQPVRDGQLLLQTVLPDVGPAGVLIALASPRASSVETDVAPVAGPAGVTTGVLLRELPPDPRPGSVLLYGGPDGLLYHSEPARRS